MADTEVLDREAVFTLMDSQSIDSNKTEPDWRNDLRTLSVRLDRPVRDLVYSAFHYGKPAWGKNKINNSTESTVGGLRTEPCDGNYLPGCVKKLISTLGEIDRSRHIPILRADS